MGTTDNGRAEPGPRAERRPARTDALAPWMVGIDLVCVAVVALAVAWRILPRDTAAPRALPRTTTGA